MDSAEIERRRQHQRQLLDELGVLSGKFLDLELDGLHSEGYTDVDDLKNASREGLRRAGLREARIDQVTKAQGAVAALGAGSTGAGGAAAGPGPGSEAAGAHWTRTSAPKGPPVRTLLDDAGELHECSPAPADNNNKARVWEIRYKDGRRIELYVDPSQVVEQFEDWALYRVSFVGSTEARGLSASIISGLVKTGKSYALQVVVPAAVAKVLRQQAAPGPLDGMTLLRIRGDYRIRQWGAGALILDLLRAFVDWACDVNVPVGEAAWREAQEVLAMPASSVELGRAGAAVVRFVHAIKVPVLILFDELQSFLQPTVGRELDQLGADYIRDVVLKQLLVYSPHTVLWCITGSSMVLTWMSIAAMPPNGYTLSTMLRQVDLPDSYPKQDMELVLSKLASQYGLGPEVGRRLLDWAGASPALLTMLVQDWVGLGRRQEVDPFVAWFLETKLVAESREEWTLGLSGLPQELRCAVLDLAFAGVGMRIDFLDRGLQQFLLPYLKQTDEGLFYLQAGYQRQILRMVLNVDGSLRNNWDGLRCSATLAQLDWGWTLLRLGEVADYLFGARAQGRWKEEIGSDGLRGVLESLAGEVASNLEGDSVRSRWNGWHWFQKVLQSPWNSADRSWYTRNKGALRTHLDMLVFFLRLSRNVLAHQKPWEGDQLVDLDVVMALSRVLDQPLSSLSDRAIKGLRMLSRNTVLKAIQAYTEQLPDSDGGGSSGGGSGGGGGGGVDASGGRYSTGGGASVAADMAQEVAWTRPSSCSSGPSHPHLPLPPPWLPFGPQLSRLPLHPAPHSPPPAPQPSWQPPPASSAAMPSPSPLLGSMQGSLPVHAGIIRQLMRWR